MSRGKKAIKLSKEDKIQIEALEKKLDSCYQELLKDPTNSTIVHRIHETEIKLSAVDGSLNVGCPIPCDFSFYK